MLRAGFPIALRVRFSDDVTREKRRLRKAILAIRDDLDPQTRRSAALAAAHHLNDWLSGTKRVFAIGAFVNFSSEIDMAPLLGMLQRAGHQIGLPVVRQKGAPLMFRRYRPNTRLLPGSFGIPAPAPLCAPIRPELFLVPFAAFDRRGYRIGYGGGFYDRTLRQARRVKGRHVVAIGYGYAAQQIPQAPREAHDLPMDGIVTERGLTWFPRNGIGLIRWGALR